jgi:hypothetical protein
MQAPTLCNVRDRSTNAPPPVLSSGNILSPIFISLYFHFRKRNSRCSCNFFIFIMIFLFLKNFLSLKLRNLKLHESGSVCNNSRLQSLGVGNSCQATIYSEERAVMMKLQWVLESFMPVFT